MNDVFGKRNSEDLACMGLALQEAENAAGEEEIPVGAVVVRDGKVIGVGHNRREGLHSPIAHAEILALQAAAANLKSWRLYECTLYVTLEPCIMCVGAIIQARIARLVFGCLDPKGGAVESLYRLCEDPRLNHRLPVTHGVLADDCSRVLSGFFASLRRRGTRAGVDFSPHNS